MWSKSRGSNESPIAFLASQCAKFGKYWSPPGISDQDIKYIVDELAIFREEAAISDPNKFNLSPEKFDTAVNTYNKHTVGSDNWGKVELVNIPPIVKQPIVYSLNDALQRIALPYQLMLNLNPCLGTPNGESRTITKTPFLYRMLMRANTQTRQWEKDNAASFDSCRSGSSALQAALVRNLRAELGFWLGEHVASVFNDFEKFFDSIDIPILLQEAIHCNFPPQLLSFLLQQHLAPRAIQANGYTSEAMIVYKSILAGCMASVDLTRVYLRRNTQTHRQQI